MSEELESPLSPPPLKSSLFGWLRFRPSFLQFLNRIEWFVAFVFLARAVQTGVGDGLIGVNISTLERRFELSSSQSAWIVGIFDLSAMIFVIVFMTLGTRCHRPRVVSIGTFSLGIGCILFVLPHAILPTYVPSGTVQPNLCNASHHENSCGDDTGLNSVSSVSRTALTMLVISRFFMGGGYPCLTIQALTYIDDAVSTSSYGLIAAIIGISTLVGPSLAYTAGSLLLNLYTYFYTIDAKSLGLHTKDPQWIGAWWLGFALSGLCFCIAALFFSGFPQNPPRSQKVIVEKGGINVKEDGNEHCGTKISNTRFWEKKLLYSAQFWSVVGYKFFMKLLTNGLSAYGPKYLEVQFGIKSSFAGVILGAVLVPGGTIGFMGGGFILKKFKLSCRQILCAMTCCTILYAPSFLVFLISCKPTNFAELSTSSLHPPNVSDILSPPCYQSCNCKDIPYTPICGSDGKQYYSPCHAGCLFRNIDTHYEKGVLINGTKTYTNCSCMSTPPDASLGEPFTGTYGSCLGQSCALFPLFLFGIGFGFMLSCAGLSMHNTAVIRTVPYSERTIALGINSAVLCLGGVIGPIVFGLVLDDSCTLWDYPCGERGVCLNYDTKRMATNLLYMCTSTAVITLFIAISAWKLYSPPDAASINEESIKGTDTDTHMNEQNGVLIKHSSENIPLPENDTDF